MLRHYPKLVVTCQHQQLPPSWWSSSAAAKPPHWEVTVMQLIYLQATTISSLGHQDSFHCLASLKSWHGWIPLQAEINRWETLKQFTFTLNLVSPKCYALSCNYFGPFHCCCDFVFIDASDRGSSLVSAHFFVLLLIRYLATAELFSLRLG